MLKQFFVVIVFVVMLVGFVFVQDVDMVVVIVNGEIIMLGQLIVMWQGLDLQMMQGLFDVVLWDLMLDQMVCQIVVVQQVQLLSKCDIVVLEIECCVYLVGFVLEKVVGVELMEDELKVVYDQVFGGEMQFKIEYNVVYILVKIKEEVDVIEVQLKDGGDFGVIVVEKLIDLILGLNKGDLGWFQFEQMVVFFVDVVKVMKKGEILVLVEMQFGWYVIKLVDECEI